MVDHPDSLVHINALLTTARTRWLQATWNGDLDKLAIAQADIDALLEQMHNLVVLRDRRSALYG